MMGSNGGEVLLPSGHSVPSGSADARLQDARDEIEFLTKALRELYLAGVPMTKEPSGTAAEWGRWFGAMHEAHEWTLQDGDPLWPEWAGPEPK